MTHSYPSGSPGVPESSIPTGAPGLMPRRTSYASVVSGTTSGTTQGYQQPSRSGAFSHLLNQTGDLSFDSHFQFSEGSSRHDLRAIDMDIHRNGGSYNGSSSWGRSARLPSFSSAFLQFTQGYGQEGTGGHIDHFFIPSYLRGSSHAQRLEAAHKVKMAARKDASSAPSSHSGSLSKSNSSANLHAPMASSYRGMAYDVIENRGMQFDVIEKAPPLEDESLAPLPSRWSNQDKFLGLEVQGDGQEVKYTGVRTTERDLEASSIRTDHPIPPQCGLYYFEVTISSRKREETSICIGFSSKDVALSRPPGWEPESWAYHGDDGHSYCGQNSGKNYGPPYSTDDVIGCGINFRTGCAFFTKNGKDLGIAFREIKGMLFPSVGMKRPGEHIRINLGQSPFVFDIDGMMLAEKERVKMQVEATSTAKLGPPLDEASLIQYLVLQYLSHDDYVETAKAFAEEIHSERQALNLDSKSMASFFNAIKEDEDAVNRQRIRMAVLDGDVDKALKHTNAFYPNVLKDNEQIYFRLRSRKFIEMIRRAAEIRSSSMNENKRSNGHGGDWYDDIINHDMEMDDPHLTSNGWDRMETEGTTDNQAEYDKLLNETITYGQVLQAEFQHDPRREVQKSLQDAFALLAYEDPINSKEVSHLLRREGRVSVAEELNSAILVSLGKSSSSALERLIKQTTVILEDHHEKGGPGAFVNINDYLKPAGSQ